MGALRDRMIRELQLRGFAPLTHKQYLGVVSRLAKHYGIAPDRLSAKQVQDYLVHLMTERGQEWNTINAVASGLKFFYRQVVNRPDIILAIPPRRRPRHLPEVLSVEELLRLFAAAAQPKERALLMTTYGGGLHAVIPAAPRRAACLLADRSATAVAVSRQPAGPATAPQ
jgi:integrase/recombinase XerD